MLPTITLLIRYVVIGILFCLLINLTAQFVTYHAYFEGHKWANGTVQKRKWEKIEHYGDLVWGAANAVIIVLCCICIVAIVAGMVVSFI